MTHIVTQYGVAKVFELAPAYRAITGDDADEKTDKVLRRVLGIGEDDLVRATWDDLASMHRE